MIVLPGAPAFTKARSQELLARIQAANPNVSGVHARYAHFVDGGDTLAPAQREVLEQLLTYGPRAEEASGPHNNALSFWVTPRLGTISPWASKATDIAHICGLEGIARVERGVAYQIEGGVNEGTQAVTAEVRIGDVIDPDDIAPNVILTD